MTTAHELSQEQLKALVLYDPLTGVMQWAQVGRGRVAGQFGSLVSKSTKVADRRRRVSIGGRQYLVHRLCWLWAYGEWPAGQIDHINGDPSDNRLANLRDTDAATNAQNRRRAHSNCKSGVLGVCQMPSGKFTARLQINGSSQRFGSYDTAEEAHQRYIEVKRQAHPGCTL